MTTKSTVWRLRAGQDKRFRSGHPWVYSNELQGSPKGHEPGAQVELQDAGGKFLARGFGNPHSLIAFRAMSRDPNEASPVSFAGVRARLERAARLRQTLGLAEVSHRLCFGEADGLPGLVIDAYRAEKGWVHVVQAHAAGMDAFIGEIGKLIDESCPHLGGSQSAIVIRNDLGVRKFEGLGEEAPRVLRNPRNEDLENATIQVQSASGGPPLPFRVNLVGGQKTGFFLDQAGNIQLAATRLKNLRSARHPAPIRILDLCCYVGQWSAQLAQLYRQLGVQVDVLIVDASATALALAKTNVEAQGARCDILKGDVLKVLAELPDRGFDFVVCDPPALIKGRKDVPAGTHAYLQLNTQVFRLVRDGGAVVSCSCSQLLEEASFIATLNKAAFRNRARARWIARGGQAPDHPVLTEFPEGHYLKSWVAIVDHE